MSYSTLLKFGTVPWNQEELLIDANLRAENKIREAIARYGAKEEPMPEGFQEGLHALNAQRVDGLLEDAGSPVIKASDPEIAEIAKNKEAAKQELEEMRAQVEAAKKEAASILENAKKDAQNVLEDARNKGYDEGFQKGSKEAREANLSKELELDDRRMDMETAFDERFNSMEQEFVENLTSIYEHVFHVDLLDHREVLLYLIEKTMRDTGLGFNFLIHVSQADYAEVQGKKEELSSLLDNGHTLEIIEDNALSQGGCMVETENGIFDCGIDTELKELSKKLRLLSYDNGN
ncbi:MAG: hypothetical protein IJU50_05995 [Lachnospiraceae bacterium]|nr:hypothetical protein [Lachnospiraceae bacterium]